MTDPPNETRIQYLDGSVEVVELHAPKHVRRPPLDPLDVPSVALIEYGVYDSLETAFRALERRVRERN